MDEPLSADLKLPEGSNLQQCNLKDDSLSEIVGTSSEPASTEQISEGLPDVGIDSLDDAGKGSSFEVSLQKESHDPLPPKESSFQVSLEPKPTEAPPLLLLDTKSGDMEDDDSVFTGDLSTMPDQLLAEPPKRDELDERTEHEIASNIEEQLREFDGSEDDISLDKNICVTPSAVSADLTRPEDIFGEDTSASAAGSEPACKSDTPVHIEQPTETSLEPVENPEDLESVEVAEALESVKDPEDLEPVEDQEALEPMAEVLENKEDESIINVERSQKAEIDAEDPSLEENVRIDNPQIETDLPDDLMEKSDDPPAENIEELPSEEIPSEEIPSEEIPSEEIPSEEIPSEEIPSEEIPSEKVSVEDILTEDIPSEGIPAEEIPAEKTSTEETPAEEISNEETPAEEIPSENRAEEIPSEDLAEEIPSKIPAEEIQSTLLPSEEPEFQIPTESSMEVDEEEVEEIEEEDNPPEEQQVEETAGKSSNDIIKIEDVEMSTIEDSKEKIDDVMLHTTDPLGKSGKTVDLENKFEDVQIDKDNLTKTETEAEKSVEEPMDEDVSIVEQLSSTKYEDDSVQIVEKEKTEKVQEAEKIEETQEKDKTIETQEEKATNRDKTVSSPTADVEIIEINESDESKETTNNDVSEDPVEKESDDVQIVEIANISVEEVINSVRKDFVSTSAEEVSKQQKDSGPPKEDSSGVQQEEDNSNEDVCLLPDSQKELTGAEKEQAILARENAEKEAEQEKKAKEKEKQSDTRHSTPTEETINEEDQVNEEAETPQDNLLDLAELEIKELNDEVKDDKCYKCRKAKPCKYKMLRNGEIKYLCDIKCVNSFRLTSKEIYTLTAKKVIITSIIGVVQNCVRCRARKSCGFRFKDSELGVYIYLCQASCLNVYIGKNVEKYLVRRKKYIVEDVGLEGASQKCIHCGEKKSCKYFFKQDDEFLYICNENCFNLLSKEEPERFRLKQRRSARGRDTGAPNPQVGSTSTTPSTTAAGQWEPDLKIVARTEAEAEAAKLDREISFTRRCGHCSSTVERSDQLLHWEMMDFCNEVCLAKYQTEVGAFCYLCKTTVPMSSLGKYCVRFGFDVRQFCTTNCLERHKKGLKVCSFCQKDISYSKVGFLAPVGTRGVFKDFCSQACMSRYDEMCNSNKKALLSECAVCNHQKLVRVEVMVDGREHQFCSNPCFSAFKFVNNIHLDQCGMCSKYFERKSAEAFTIYQDKDPTVFCSKICLNIFISLNRKIVPCQWCKVKKYDFDMIQKQQGAQILMMICSVNCLNQQKVAKISVGVRVCDNCHKETSPQYHLTMSDGTIRNFCNYNCVLVFRGQFGRSVTWTIDSTESTSNPKDVNNKKTPFPTGQPKRARGKASASAAAVAVPVPIPVSAPIAAEEPKDAASIIPVISSVESLAPGPAPTTSTAPVQAAPVVLPTTQTEPTVTVVKKRGRPRLNVSAAVVPPEQSPQQSPVQVQRQSQTKPPETSEDDQPLVRLRSLRSGGAQNIQTQESPKNQHNVSITAKALTSNSHTQTKAVQKKSVGISAVLEKVPEEPKKPEMVEKSTMTIPEKAVPQEKEKPKQVTIIEKLSSSSSASAEIKTQVVVVPQQLPTVANKQTMCKPAAATKGTSCRPHPSSVQCQTDDELGRKILVPIPVPIYVPQPMYMYSAPFPVPVPIPLPIPVPIFIPTTRNSAEGIMKEIKKIQDKMPTDPFEAELLMMAEMVAGDKKKNESDSDSEPDAIKYEEEYHHHQPPEPSEPSNSFGEDVLQMALKMATECDEPAVDLESAMTTNTITPPETVQHMSQEPEESTDMPHQMIVIDGQRQVIRGRKRPASPVSVSPVAPPPPKNNRVPVTPPKRQRREIQVIGQSDHVIKEPVEKPDANLCLKYTFGVNAWKQWVMTKNADLEKSSIKRKPFKSELLQLTADELNYSLCLFVKEVRKPNGSEYAPDTIYYLVLGIQQYLYENGRIDNIFTDPYYERFTDCLDEVAKKFSVLYNDSQYIVTRVEEEHLWECKQLGAHSPHVLLSTLMFFNTKHFNLTTVEEHMQLSFSHIMKHWKRSPPGTKSPGSRNVLLRFYPPQSGLEANPKKKKVYEQQENEDNPLRCPVKLYEFYLSKCPESVKTRNDVFYLQPERSCVPDSPVWYSTQPLSREALSKMLHRVKMVKEINIALLTS